MPDLCDTQAIALKQDYPTTPTDPETGVTALLQRYRADQGDDDWEEYVARMHAVCDFFAVPQSSFVDAQAVAWGLLTL